jgi:N-methylhydantoinase A
VENRPIQALLGVDTGGTFTDLVLIAGDQVRTHKLPSTPDNPSRAVLEGINFLLDTQQALVFHGSTVATNALLEGKGATVALVTTEGFGDMLHIGRQQRPQLYALHPRARRTLVPRKKVVEVRERVQADGSVTCPLEEAEIRRIIRQVTDIGCTSVALCLLHAYANPIHERQLQQALEEAGLQVSASHRVLPEYREFERASTTAVNAAVSPVMTRYLKHLQTGLGNRTLRIMQSNGGAIHADTAGSEAVRTILSGPAAGKVGAFATAGSAGFQRIITFDMGGTSTDVGLCDGEVPVTSETVLAGWPVKVPMIDIHTVGAGGGSIARIDAGGALRVGPQSAGADPGPVCYGKGSDVTVTDANLYLGRLLPDRFLGGRMLLDEDRCRQAVEQLAERAGLPPARLAEGILEVAEATMAGALRVVSVAKGYDPRDFSLLPFGGAGGLHVCSLADTLGIPRALIPAHPGLLSAVGLVLADVIRDYSLSVLRSGETSLATLEKLFAPLEKRALSEMAAEGVSGEALRLERALDMRYRGQSFELTVPLDKNFGAVFHDRYRHLYGYHDQGRDTEIVTLRLRAVGSGPQPNLGNCFHSGASPQSLDARKVIWNGDVQPWPVYQRIDLPVGCELCGPALIVEETSTHVLAPGWHARTDERFNIVLERRPACP